MEPSDVIRYMIALDGVFPNPGTSVNSTIPFLGEISIDASPNTPGGWAPCDGRLLNIADYPDLFNVLGTLYGGDGETTFGIPDLRGRTAIGANAQFPLTMQFGSETITLSSSQVPAIPEPASLTLLTLSSAALLRRRTRHLK